jgi:hypothetical protein
MEIFALVVLGVVGWIAWTLSKEITKSPQTPIPTTPPKKKRSLLDRSDPENEAFFSEGPASPYIGLLHRNRKAPALPTTYSAKKPWEDGYRSRPSGMCNLRISYSDAEDRDSERDIAIYKSGATNYKFDAWCSLRRARRTFIFSRIQSAVDLETGEVLTVAQVFRRVHPTRKVPEEIA